MPVPEKVPVLEMLKIYQQYLVTFIVAGKSDRAEAVFKDIFRKAVARATTESSRPDLDAEIQGLIALAHAVFVENGRAALIVAECYSPLGDEVMIGKRKVDSRAN